MTKYDASLRRLLIAFSTAGLIASAAFPLSKANAELLNCVQYVKSASPVALSGDAYRWWDNADGRYGRGTRPRPGSVMVFDKSSHLPHGHVAIVKNMIDDHTLLIDHANWSRFSGQRGRIERAVRVIDVSAHNDWSAVRVWYHSLKDIGQTTYRLRGFVYPRGTERHHRR